MSKLNTILLFAGETKKENIPMGYISSIALMPLRGKPIIWWQFENLKNQGINDIILVLNKKDIKLINYVKNVLSDNFNIKIILVNGKDNILTSLKRGLKAANCKVPTRIILGDTLITSNITEETDLVLTSVKVGISDYWCLVSKNESGVIKNFYDKQKDIDTKHKETVIGYYSFSNTRLIYNCAKITKMFGKSEISDALNLYNRKINLKAKTTDNWYDLGHTSGLIEAKNALFNLRSFNSIEVDTDLGLLTKISSNIKKLEDEAFWYENIPPELKVLTPRLISFNITAETAALTQELYGYPSLSELLLTGEINLQDWKIILEKLFKLNCCLQKYENKQDSSPLKWLYLDKTKERLEELKSQNNFWDKILNKKTIVINGMTYKNINELLNEIYDFVDLIIKNTKITIMHGDYCLSNILFDSSNYLFKLIDPRGRLNGERTIYGDPRYDIAKLRHSICGLYDFIVNGLFTFKEFNHGFEYKIFTSKDYSKLELLFNDLILQYKFDLNEIKFIEGLLFLSMIPLHKDNIDRQKIFYLKAVILLNEVLHNKTAIYGVNSCVQKHTCR